MAHVVQDDGPLSPFVHVRGRVTTHADLDALRRFATGISARYMGEGAPPNSASARLAPASSSSESRPSA